MMIANADNKHKTLHVSNNIQVSLHKMQSYEQTQIQQNNLLH